MRLLLAGGTLLGILLLVPNLWGAYQRVQLARSPYRDSISFLQTQATVPPAPLLLTEQPLYRQVYPYLRNDFRLKLAGGDVLFAPAPTVPDLLESETQVWLLATGPQAGPVQAAVAAAGQPLVTYSLESGGNLTLFDLGNNGGAPAPLARAQNGLELISYQAEQDAGNLKLTLYWQSVTPPDKDYTVFTQLLNEQGALQTGHDSFPAEGTQPTTGWQPSAVIVDTHLIPLPDDLGAGDYQLVAGMYDAAGERLPFFSSDGQALANNAIVLENIALDE